MRENEVEFEVDLYDVAGAEEELAELGATDVEVTLKGPAGGNPMIAGRIAEEDVPRLAAWFRKVGYPNVVRELTPRNRIYPIP